MLFGAQLSTGDPDDPNTADISLSNFADDLTVSMDQAYAQYAKGNFTLTAGKFPLPFIGTELVWDGDLNPQGLSAAYGHVTSGGTALKASTIYFVVDEAPGGPDSRMLGGHAGFITPKRAFTAGAAAAYFNYRMSSLAGADPGDIRSNLLTTDGRYLSDFDLFDAIVFVNHTGLGDRWPVRIVGDYVHNLGARTAGDEGFGVDAYLGRAAEAGDWRFRYGYAQAEVDAVLGAFSHDNLTIATNYQLHTLSIDYLPQSHTALNLTWYHYGLLDPSYAASDPAQDWQDRVRLNLVFDF